MIINDCNKDDDIKINIRKVGNVNDISINVNMQESIIKLCITIFKIFDMVYIVILF